MGQTWYKMSVPQVCKELSVNPETGITTEEALKRLERYGYNELKEKEKETLIQKIINQLKDFLIIILIVASIVSAFMGETIDAIVIIAIVIINAALGVIQEGKAEKALEALKKMSAPNARVLRDGKIETIPARELVPGDVLQIETGDILPADIRIIQAFNLKIEESSLTGESVPVDKYASDMPDTDVGLGDRTNMGYMSTIVSYGHGRGIVVGTGHNTEIGTIADKIQEIDDEETPLQQKLEQLGKFLGVVCLGVCVIVFIVGLLREGRITKEGVVDMFMVAVSLAVAAIPEGLPAVVTIVLALGMKRMVDRNAIVRKLLAVETLGCVDVICSDKTGTLTQNEMTVVRAYAGDRMYKVNGSGYNPQGEFCYIDGETPVLELPGELKLMLTIGVLCNDSVLQKNQEEQWCILGDPTEGALIVAGAKGGLSYEKLKEKHPRIQEIPFESERKMMTTFHEGILDTLSSLTKGAPDIVLERCSHILINGHEEELTDLYREKIRNANSSLASSALRVLAFAYRRFEVMPKNIDTQSIETNMVFVGLMGMIDPARVEAKKAIKVCRTAGIKPVMITGDYKDTAVAIAKDLGLMQPGDGVLTGRELDSLNDDGLLECVENISIYARVSPEHKVRIVDALKRKGHVASMTGDGVNDAMALKKADIGVAMGITGTDVAKGTADIVLTDDNFSSIVSAVEEGRIIYSNIRKFVFFLLSCNVGEILIVFLSMLAGLPVPLVPIQLLWLNLITDSFPALALGTEKGDKDIMTLKPRNVNTPIVDKKMISGIAVQSTALVIAVLGAYLVGLCRYPDYKDNIAHLSFARTYAFTTLIFAELLRAYSSRSEKFTIFKIGFFTNKIMVWASVLSFVMLLAVIYIPFARPIFETTILSIRDWVVILLFSLIPFASAEIFKAIAGTLGKK